MGGVTPRDRTLWQPGDTPQCAPHVPHTAAPCRDGAAIRLTSKLLPQTDFGVPSNQILAKAH
jgi:hypothetical protein